MAGVATLQLEDVAFGTWLFGDRTAAAATHEACADFDHWLATRSDFQGQPGALHEDERIRRETRALRLTFAGREGLAAARSARITEVDDEVSDLGVYYRRADALPADPPPTFWRGSVISERSYQLIGTGQAEFLRLLRDYVRPWLAQQGARLVAYGHDPLESSDEVITLFAFRSLHDWHRLSRPAAELAELEVARAWHQRAALIRRHRGRLLAVATDFGTPA